MKPHIRMWTIITCSHGFEFCFHTRLVRKTWETSCWLYLVFLVTLFFNSSTGVTNTHISCSDIILSILFDDFSVHCISLLIEYDVACSFLCRFGYLCAFYSVLSKSEMPYTPQAVFNPSAAASSLCRHVSRRNRPDVKLPLIAKC